MLEPRVLLEEMRVPLGEPPHLLLAPALKRGDFVVTGVVSPSSAPMVQMSSVHFMVHPEMTEVQAFAKAHGWLAQDYRVSVAWQELHFTTDGWKTTRVVRSTDVPSPVVGGYFFLQGIPEGAMVEFAIHVGLACHAPQDTAGSRDTGELWLNNGGANYQQVTR